MKAIAKSVLRVILGDYSIYQIYECASSDVPLSRPATNTTFRVTPVDAFAINSSADSLIREQAEYAGPGSQAYACFDHDRIVGVCFYWFGDRYMKRNFWPLHNGEAKLVQIISLPDMRSRGVATLLIAGSYRDMVQKGFSRTFARIWHSNTPSKKAFEYAGWKQIALVLEINPFRQTRPIRMCFNLRPRGVQVESWR